MNTPDITSTDSIIILTIIIILTLFVIFMITSSIIQAIRKSDHYNKLKIIDVVEKPAQC